MIIDYTKQSDLIDVLRFDKPIHILGVGALGSWIAFFLLKMGFKNIHIYDYDNIEEHNLPNQMFMENQIGKSKLDAIEEIYKNFFIDEDLRITKHYGKLNADSNLLKGIVFCAVDSMKSRKELFERFCKYSTKITLWIEGRLSLYGAYVYTVPNSSQEFYKFYENTFYEDTEAEVSACGISQTALPAAVNAASIMIMNMIEFTKDPSSPYNAIEYSVPWMDCIKAKW